MTHIVSVDEAKKQLAELIDISSGGAEVVITDRGRPIARLIAVGPNRKRVAGLNRGVIWTSEDFDDPLPDEFWVGRT